MESRIGVFQRHDDESTHVAQIDRVKAGDFEGAARPLE